VSTIITGNKGTIIKAGTIVLSGDIINMMRLRGMDTIVGMIAETTGAMTAGTTDAMTAGMTVAMTAGMTVAMTVALNSAMTGEAVAMAEAPVGARIG
jgi:hypothetical protein